MTKYLITPTLLNSFSFYKNYEGENEPEVRKDFLNCLSRERFKPNEAMQKGIDFENDIQDYCNQKYLFYDFGSNEETESGLEKIKQYEKCITEIGNICENGLWQQVVKKDIEVNDCNYLLYGKCDVIKLDSIYDIKRTSSYDLGEFQESSQHRIYLYCSDMPKFSYLISNGRDWWKEDYYNNPNIEQEIKVLINELVSHLANDKEASDFYYSKWASKS